MGSVNISDIVSRECRQSFADQGYLVARGLLDVEHDIEPFREAYIQYLDGLADILMGDTKPDLAGDFSALPFAKRLALLLGFSGDAVLAHLEPTHSVTLDDYPWRPDLPSAQTPELFGLIRNEKLLDALECLIGPEILACSNYHIHMKLSSQDLDLAAAAARAYGQHSDRHSLWDFLVGATEWHRDTDTVMAGARQNNRVTAWTPITEATLESGCLEVVPGSHRADITSPPSPSVCENPVSLPAAPGDVIFFDHRLLHGARPNQTEDQMRWAFNCRYQPCGEPGDRLYLPSFVARSRKAPEQELHDPDLWSQMWRHAVQYAVTNLRPFRNTCEISAAEADALRAHWLAKVPSDIDWLRLGAAEEESSNAGSRSPIESLLREES